MSRTKLFQYCIFILNPKQTLKLEEKTILFNQERNQLRQKVFQALLAMFFIICFFPLSATNYYVSNSGNDSNPGTSESLAWKTIAKVNASTLKAGDQILFKKGDTWREQLTIKWSGASGNHIIFSSYGTGDKPRILGSKIETSWTKSSGNIWISNNTFSDPYALPNHCNIWFVETDGDVTWGNIKKADIASLAAEYDWVWSGNKIYIYSPTDPNTRYAGVEVGQRENCINLNHKNYITIDGLELAYYSRAGINEAYPIMALTGLTVQNCYIHHSGIKDSNFAVGIYNHHSNSLIRNNEIHDSGRRNISLFSSGSTSTILVKNIIVEGNTLHHGFHTTGVDLINTASGTTFDNITIRNNLIYDDPSETVDEVESKISLQIFIANQGGAAISNVYIHHNIHKYTKNTSISLEAVKGGYVYNNTCYGVNPNIMDTGSGHILLTKGTTATVKNNLCYIQNATGGFSGIFVSTTAGTVTLDNNLYYSQASDARIVSWRGTAYTAAKWATYKSVTGQDTNSPTPANPLFKSSTDYTLQSGSPAINKGVNVGLTTDFKGNPIVGIPDIGAFEYGDNSDVIPPVVSAFTIPGTSTSLNVPITAFTATDNIGVTGYILTETSGTPTAGLSGWSSAKPTSYTFSSTGVKTLYAWVKDAAGNISSSLKASVNISSQVSTVYSTEDISICEGSVYADENELVINGDFTTSASWSVGNSAVIGNGVLSLKGTSTYAFQKVSVVNGSTYRLTFEVKKATSIDGLYLSYLGFGASSLKIPHTVGIHSVDVVCKDETKPLQIVTSTTASNDVEIDNISLKKVWTSAGQYQRILKTASGTDSIVTTNLTVNPVYTVTTEAAICEGETYSFGSKMLSEPGEYTEVFETVNGCDSTVVLSLTVNEKYNITENITISEGDNYKGWTVGGIYQRNLISSAGCDSVVITYLNIEKANVEQNSIHTINLAKGWNIISSYLIPFDCNMESVVASLRNVGTLVKVENEVNHTYEQRNKNLGWVNNIGNYQKTEGYRIQVYSDCAFEIRGQQIELPLSIQLQSGWNIISFPVNGTVDAMQVIKPLIDAGVLYKVQDEKGNSIENWHGKGWINGIGNFEAGKGYIVQVSSNAILTINESYTKSVQVIPENPTTTYFQTNYDGNGIDHMNVNITDLTNSQLNVGDELAVFDNNICVGAVKLTEQHFEMNVVSIPASASEYELINGYSEGNPIQLKVWRMDTNEENNLSAQTIEGEMIFNRQASVFIGLSDLTKNVNESLELGISVDVYPNPASQYVNIRFSSSPDFGTSIAVLDISGRKVLSQEIQSDNVVIRLENLQPGTYFVKIPVNSGYLTHKLVKR